MNNEITHRCLGALISLQLRFCADAVQMLRSAVTVDEKAMLHITEENSRQVQVCVCVCVCVCVFVCVNLVKAQKIQETGDGKNNYIHTCA